MSPAYTATYSPTPYTPVLHAIVVERVERRKCSPAGGLADLDADPAQRKHELIMTTMMAADPFLVQ